MFQRCPKESAGATATAALAAAAAGIATATALALRLATARCTAAGAITLTATGLLRAGMGVARGLGVRATCMLARRTIATRQFGLARRAVAPADRGLRLEARHIADVHVLVQQAHDLAQQLGFVLRD